MQKFFDISIGIDENLPVWPGDPRPEITKDLQIKNGDIANTSVIHMGNHVGTHIDAPSHFFDGAATIDKIPIDKMIGPVQVIRINNEIELITEEVLEVLSIKTGFKKVLFRTRNSEIWMKNTMDFDFSFVGFSKDAAQYLVDKGIELIGVDYLSVAPFNDPISAHKELLSSGVVILEGLNLSEVDEGEYRLYCLPIKFIGLDGGPARAILEC
ncbi:MAG: cyclase family protein [Anaerolineaceae bacterium]|nr:cyclase family protein [Anaerolineaceae bacterium]